VSRPVESWATIDDVMATVTEARHRGPEALAALALRYGADAVGWEIRHCALRRELIDTERGMDEAREERDAAREALAAKDSAPDLDYPARAEVWRLRESVAALQDERDRVVQEREVFGLRASAAERERDEARAERDALRARPTYEARTVAPTEEERGAHEAAGGLWLVRTNGGSFHVLKIWRGTLAIGVMPETCLPLGADGLPCAWPVVASE
jgi:hypothetical protein